MSCTCCSENNHVNVVFPVIILIGSQYISPDPSFAVTGGNTTLTCHHPSHSNATVSWIKGDPNALGNGGIVNDTSIEPSGSSLFISSFRASELSGKYMCIVDPSEEEDNDKTVSCPAEIRHACEYHYLFTRHTRIHKILNDIIDIIFPHPSHKAS